MKKSCIFPHKSLPPPWVMGLGGKNVIIRMGPEQSDIMAAQALLLCLVCKFKTEDSLHEDQGLLVPQITVVICSLVPDMYCS